MKIFAVFTFALCMSAPCKASNDFLKDDLGRKWSLKEHPLKVASTFLAGDEILSELVKGSNVQFIACSTLADKGEYSNILEQAKLIPHRIGNNAEVIAKIKPDLVFMASWNSPQLSKMLSNLKIKTFTIGAFNSIDDIERNIQLMGSVLHLESNAKKMVLKMQQSMPQVPANGKKVLHFDPSGITLGKKTIFDSLITRLGFSNVTQEVGWPKISPEWIAQSHPDLIISSGEDSQFPTLLALISGTPGWKGLNPVKKKQIVLIPNRLLSSASQFISSAYSRFLEDFSKMERSP